MNYAYIRVSSVDQHPDRQIIAMQEHDISSKNIYIDRWSGKTFARPAYQMMLKRLRKGDVLFIKSIDRLGRNYDAIQEEWRKITKEKKVDIVVLDMPLLDTRQGRDLMGTLIADIVLQLLSYVAQTERELIRQRQAEGIAAAKKRGVKFGREPIMRTERHNRAVQEYRSGLRSARDAALYCGVSHKTLLKWAKEDDHETTELVLSEEVTQDD